MTDGERVAVNAGRYKARGPSGRLLLTGLPTHAARAILPRNGLGSETWLTRVTTTS
jgi:hypothetical protein